MATSEFNRVANKFKSKFEMRFAHNLEEKGIKYEYEPDAFPFTQVHNYTPDFKLGSIYIETKGKFTGRDRTKHLLIKQTYPELDVRFVFQRASNKLSRVSKTSYSDWCDKHGFKWSEGFIPPQWEAEASKQRSAKASDPSKQDRGRRSTKRVSKT
jgi:hypothetical protein